MSICVCVVSEFSWARRGEAHTLYFAGFRMKTDQWRRFDCYYIERFGYAFGHSRDDDFIDIDATRRQQLVLGISNDGKAAKCG